MTDTHTITITPKTTIGTLLDTYPFLKGYLAAYHPEFRKLTNPILRMTIGRMATIDKAAEMACVPLNQFMADIASAVEKKTGTRPPVADSAAAGGIDPRRLEVLKQIIVDLHADHPMDELSARFGALIEDVEAGEIAAMEQRLIDEGMPAEEVKRLCDVHVQVFAEALDEHRAATRAAPGHPIDTFRRENQALLQVLTSLRKVAGAIRAADDRDAAWAQFKPALSSSLERVRRDGAALPAQGEPALPVPRAPRRGGTEQGDVGAARRYPRRAQGRVGGRGARRRRAGRAAPSEWLARRRTTW